MTRILLALLAGLVLSMAATGCSGGDPEDDAMSERRPVRDAPRQSPSIPTVNMSETESDSPDE